MSVREREREREIVLYLFIRKLLTFCGHMFQIATNASQQNGLHLLALQQLDHYHQLMLLVINHCEKRKGANHGILGQLWCKIGEQLTEFVKDVRIYLFIINTIIIILSFVL